MMGQINDAGAMGSSDGQLDETGLPRGLGDFIGVVLKIDLLQRRFDGDFPNAGGTEINLLAAVGEHFLHVRREPLRRP